MMAQFPVRSPIRASMLMKSKRGRARKRFEGELWQRFGHTLLTSRRVIVVLSPMPTNGAFMVIGYQATDGELNTSAHQALCPKYRLFSTKSYRRSPLFDISL